MLLEFAVSLAESATALAIYPAVCCNSHIHRNAPSLCVGIVLQHAPSRPMLHLVKLLSIGVLSIPSLIVTTKYSLAVCNHHCNIHTPPHFTAHALYTPSNTGYPTPYRTTTHLRATCCQHTPLTCTRRCSFSCKTKKNVHPTPTRIPKGQSMSVRLSPSEWYSLG